MLAVDDVTHTPERQRNQRGRRDSDQRTKGQERQWPARQRRFCSAGGARMSLIACVLVYTRGGVKDAP